jgi:LysR family nod box-dependent transcriptional activator
MARFDLNLLAALDALLIERNVTRAADRLNVSQPTMSGMLLRLRYQFRDPLLVRVGRRLELTPLGCTLKDSVREALRSVETLVGAEPVFDPATSKRTFKVMASDYCTSIFLPRIVASLARSAPGVRLIMQPLHTPLERLASAEIDLCVTADDLTLLSKYADEEKLRSEYLFSDDLVSVVSLQHPLDEGATLEEYLSFPHVGIQMEGMRSSIEAESLRHKAQLFRPTYVVAQFSQVACMVAQTQLVGVVQARLARLAALCHPIRMFRPPFDMPTLNEVMLWHPRHDLDPAQVWLREIFREEGRAWCEDDEAADGASLRGPPTRERRRNSLRVVG